MDDKNIGKIMDALVTVVTRTKDAELRALLDGVDARINGGTDTYLVLGEVWCEVAKYYASHSDGEGRRLCRAVAQECDCVADYRIWVVEHHKDSSNAMVSAMERAGYRGSFAAVALAEAMVAFLPYTD